MRACAGVEYTRKSRLLDPSQLMQNTQPVPGVIGVASIKQGSREWHAVPHSIQDHLAIVQDNALCYQQQQQQPPEAFTVGGTQIRRGVKLAPQQFGARQTGTGATAEQAQTPKSPEPAPAADIPWNKDVILAAAVSNRASRVADRLISQNEQILSKTPRMDARAWDEGLRYEETQVFETREVLARKPASAEQLSPPSQSPDHYPVSTPEHRPIFSHPQDNEVQDLGIFAPGYSVEQPHDVSQLDQKLATIRARREPLPPPPIEARLT